MIPADVLSANRAELAVRVLDRDALVSREIRTKDDSGGQTVTYGPQRATRMGRAQGIGGQQELQQKILDKIGNRTFFVLTFPATFAIDEDDIVEQITPAYEKFRVVAIQNRDVTYEMIRRVIVVAA